MESTLALDLFKLFIVVLLVLANGFFVAAEFSLVSVRRTRIAELAARGNITAKFVEKAIKNPDRVIAATQLGITIASLGLGWIGEPALSHFILPLVNLFPAEIQSEVSHSIAAGISFALITFLHVVVGELAPKSIALQDPERTSLFVARPTLWTEAIFKPVIWALNGTGNALLRLVGVHPASGHQLAHSVEELKMLVTASLADGVVEAKESEMLHAVFDFGDTFVRQVMVPRTEIIALEAETPLQDIIDLVIETPHTKFPVYEHSLDQVLGVVHVKEVLRRMKDPTNQNCTARDMTSETIFVPETTPVSELLIQFRVRRQHIAIVLDEFGGTAGMVTLEDLLEEIVGEVRDPFEETSSEIQTQPDGSALIDGLSLIEEVNEQLGLALQDPDYDTIAGYVLGRLGRMAAKGDSVESEGVLLRVEEMDGLRIARVSLTVTKRGDEGTTG